MSFWRKIKIKIRNRWNNQEYRKALKGTIIVIGLLFIYLVFVIAKMTIETNSYDKIIPWLKMLVFSVSYAFGIIFVISIIPGFIIYKLNKIMYHEKSIMAWIPIVNIYLLGKLTINEMVGRLLILGLIIVLCFDVPNIMFILYAIILVVIYVYAIIKYIKLAK